MKAWKYGDDINTDMLFPGKYTYTCSTADEVKPHLLEDLDPEFAEGVKEGDLIFAGKNFGCGSSREQPVLGLKAVGSIDRVQTGKKRITLAGNPEHLGHVLNHLQGAYSLLFLFADRIEAARDPYGIRPLSIGQTEKGAYVVASETCAFDVVNAKFIREVEPGEIVRLDKDGLHSSFFVKRGTVTPAHCIFEHVYPTSW